MRAGTLLARVPAAPWQVHAGAAPCSPRGLRDVPLVGSQVFLVRIDPRRAKSGMSLVQSALKLTQSHHLSSALSCWVCLGAGVFALSVTFQASPECLPQREFMGPPRSHSPSTPALHCQDICRVLRPSHEGPISTDPAWPMSSHREHLPNQSAKPVPSSSSTHQDNGEAQRGAALGSGHTARRGPAEVENQMPWPPKAAS